MIPRSKGHKETTSTKKRSFLWIPRLPLKSCASIPMRRLLHFCKIPYTGSPLPGASQDPFRFHDRSASTWTKRCGRAARVCWSTWGWWARPRSGSAGSLMRHDGRERKAHNDGDGKLGLITFGACLSTASRSCFPSTPLHLHIYPFVLTVWSVSTRRLAGGLDTRRAG